MPHYIGLIHKDRDSCYGLSFPDVPGVFTAGDSIDETMRQAVGVLEFAARGLAESRRLQNFPCTAYHRRAALGPAISGRSR